MVDDFVPQGWQPVAMTSVNVPSINATSLLRDHKSELDFAVLLEDHYVDASHRVKAGRRNVGVFTLAGECTPYEAIAEVEEAGFFPAFAVEMISLWSSNRRVWNGPYNKVVALADACIRNPHSDTRVGLWICGIPKVASSAYANKLWEAGCIYLRATNDTAMLKRGTGVAVILKTSNGGRQASILDEWDSPSSPQANHLRLAKIRVKAGKAQGPESAQYQIAAMIGGLLAEMSGKLDQIPDHAAFEELVGVIRSGAILNYSEQVDIYNKLHDIKSIMLDQYSEN